jgi:hypothetical protein
MCAKKEAASTKGLVQNLQDRALAPARRKHSASAAN